METVNTGFITQVSQQALIASQEAPPNEEEEKIIGIENVERLVLPPFLVLTGVISMTLNGSLLYAIFKFESLRTKPLFSILGCQVLCDICTPVIFIPVAIYILSTDEELSRPPAAIQGALRQGVSAQLPMHLLTLLTVERYTYICKPFRYQVLFSARRVRIYLMVSFLLMATITTTMATSCETFPTRWQLSCVFNALSGNRFVTAAGMAFYGVCPAAVQARCILGIGRTALRQNMMVHPETSQRTAHGSMSRPAISKAVSGVMRLCGTYWISWAPAMAAVGAVLLLKTSGAPLSSGLQVFMRYAVVGLMTLLPLINPSICLFSMRELRQKWLQALKLTPQGPRSTSSLTLTTSVGKADVLRNA